mmetsp:Transcript_107635/g.185587  ORF Transcript_107635/g.185587 Transcript_107635/m.185587 type:complete len:220 (-) Transcript_107635:152-811(-)
MWADDTSDVDVELHEGTFERCVNDPSKTVIVFFYKSGFRDSNRMWVLAQDLGLCLKTQPDFLVTRFNVGRNAQCKALHQSLIHPNGPVKKKVPRIVIYPKGNKQGVKYPGFPGNSFPPTPLQVRNFAFKVDRANGDPYESGAYGGYGRYGHPVARAEDFSDTASVASSTSVSSTASRWSLASLFSRSSQSTPASGRHYPTLNGNALRGGQAPYAAPYHT